MSDSTKVVIGLDLGDKLSHGFGRNCETKEEWRFVNRTTREGIRQQFKGLEGCRVAIETGTHSRWVSSELARLGHEVIVANPRRVALIYKSGHKSDPSDAKALCMLADYDPQLLAPIKHRGEAFQADLAVLRSRAQLVEARSKLVNHVRGMVKSTGERITPCSTPAFAHKVQEQIPEELVAALKPILDVIAELSEKIKAYDRTLEQMCKKYPVTESLRQVSGVGALTALCFFLTIEDPWRFQRNRTAGPYLGLTPRKSQSGETDPELSITHAGDRYLRALLVQSAHYILGPFGPDTDLRRWGEALASRGGKNAKKRAVVAVARKLAVLLLSLWKSGAEYEPLRQAQKKQSKLTSA